VLAAVGLYGLLAHGVSSLLPWRELLGTIEEGRAAMKNSSEFSANT